MSSHKQSSVLILRRLKRLINLLNDIFFLIAVPSKFLRRVNPSHIKCWGKSTYSSFSLLKCNMNKNFEVYQNIL